MRKTAMGLKAAMLAGVMLLQSGQPALAQGQDSTRAERDALVIAQLIKGRYDNFNQVYFDRRLKLPEDERHQSLHMLVNDDPQSDLLHLSLTPSDKDGEPLAEQHLLASLSPEDDGWRVRMQLYRPGVDGAAPTLLEGCDMLWQQEAGQFRAVAESDQCKADGLIAPQTILLGEHELWWGARGDAQRPNALERARDFRCDIDFPGVGGGVDIPFTRTKIDHIHDKGDTKWVTLSDGSEIAVRLTNVRWQINNLDNIFTRPSLVVYVNERTDGEVRTLAYSWTQPDAQRIGINLKRLLVNCYMLSNEEIEPFYREEPQL